MAPPGASGVRLRGRGSPEAPRGPSTTLCPPSRHATAPGALAGPWAPSRAGTPAPPGPGSGASGVLRAPHLWSRLHGRFHPGGGVLAAAGQGACAGSGQGLAIGLNLVSAQPSLLRLSVATHAGSPTPPPPPYPALQGNWPPVSRRRWPEDPQPGGWVPGLVSRESVPSWGLSLPICQVGVGGLDSEVLRLQSGATGV